MPTRERSLGRSVLASPTEIPFTRISPFWNGSRPLTHLMSVDLPLPEGPHTTTTSPFATSVEHSASTWKLPYHLLTLRSEIMLPLTDHGEPGLQVLHVPRGREAHDEVHERDEEVHLDEAPVAVGDLGSGAAKVGRRDDVHERSVLEQDDGLGEKHRQHVAERLRQGDIPHHLPVVEPQRIARRDLPARD